MSKVPLEQAASNDEETPEETRRRKVDAAARALVELGWPGYAVGDLLYQWGEGWAPSEEAIVAGRIIDGEARTDWKLVPDVPEDDETRTSWTTDGELKMAAELLQSIADTCRAGDREQLSRLEPARRAWLGLPSQDEERRAHFVACLEAWAEHVANDRCPTIQSMLSALADGSDPALGTISRERLMKALRAIDVRKVDREDGVARRSGGRGKRGPLQVAAELAVEVGALGLKRRKGETIDDAVERARHALKVAVKRVGSHNG